MIDVATLSVIRRWALREQLSIRKRPAKSCCRQAAQRGFMSCRDEMAKGERRRPCLRVGERVSAATGWQCRQSKQQ